MVYNIIRESVKEVQGTSCQGLGVFPKTKKSPKIGGFRGLTTTFSVLCIGV
jgi:hypothetical protein